MSQPLNRRSLIAVMLLLTLSVVLARDGDAVDCSGRFRVGAYGVPADDPALRSGALTVQGFTPIYLNKQRLEETDSETCRYVTAYDVFRLVYKGRVGLLVAGCYGDFDGDGRRDYALLLASAEGDKALPYVFLARGTGYLVVVLDPVVDPYGFNRDRSLWPGPFCLKKPATGVFKGFDEETTVVGDVIQVGWYGYVWRRNVNQFEALQVID